MNAKPVALITGGGRGIGIGIACALASAGYDIAITGTRPEVPEALEKLSCLGAKAVYLCGSISVGLDRTRVYDALFAEFGRLDVLVNNAGVAPKERLDVLETTEESFDYVVGTNLRGSFFMAQEGARRMIPLVGAVPNRTPMIINISSVSSFASSVNRGEYCISKAGISMVTKLFADRLAEYGINVYEIQPGIIATGMTSAVSQKYDDLIAGGLTPIRRWGYPEDVGKAVAAIASGAFAFSTGEVFHVDGGFHIRRL